MQDFTALPDGYYIIQIDTERNKAINFILLKTKPKGRFVHFLDGSSVVFPLTAIQDETVFTPIGFHASPMVVNSISLPLPKAPE